MVALMHGVQGSGFWTHSTPLASARTTLIQWC